MKHPPNARLALTKYSVADTPAGPGKFLEKGEAMQRRATWRESVAKLADDAVTAAVRPSRLTFGLSPLRMTLDSFAGDERVQGGLGKEQPQQRFDHLARCGHRRVDELVEGCWDSRPNPPHLHFGSRNDGETNMQRARNAGASHYARASHFAKVAHPRAGGAP